MKNIDIDMVIFENIDIDNAILKNIDSDILMRTKSSIEDLYAAAVDLEITFLLPRSTELCNCKDYISMVQDE